MGECKDYEVTVLRNMIHALKDGFRMGVEHGNRVFNNKRKIDVEYIENATELEFTRIDDSTIMNYGRSMPF